jgi:hypothetical protein
MSSAPNPARISVPSLEAAAANSESPFCYTSNTLCAAALITLGIPFIPGRPLINAEVNGEERVIWLFQMESLDGLYKTKEMMAAWDDEKWCVANPDHPFVYAKYALLNRNRLLEVIKNDVPLVAMKRGDAICLVRKGSAAHANLSLAQ